MNVADIFLLQERAIRLQHAIVRALAEMEKYKEQDENLAIAASDLAREYRDTLAAIERVQPGATAMLPK